MAKEAKVCIHIYGSFRHNFISCQRHCFALAPAFSFLRAIPPTPYSVRVGRRLRLAPRAARYACFFALAEAPRAALLFCFCWCKAVQPSRYMRGREAAR